MQRVFSQQHCIKQTRRRAEVNKNRKHTKLFMVRIKKHGLALTQEDNLQWPNRKQLHNRTIYILKFCAEDLWIGGISNPIFVFVECWHDEKKLKKFHQNMEREDNQAISFSKCT